MTLASASWQVFLRHGKPRAQIAGLRQLPVSNVQQSRGAKMWVAPPKKKTVDEGTVGPLFDSLRLLKALQAQLSNSTFRVFVQPLLKKEVNANVLRGRIFLPNQLPKDEHAQEDIIAVIVKADSPDAELATKLGANHVGDKELIEQIVEGVVNPTKLLCHPDQLPLLVRNSVVAKFLGQKGLIPSEKRGTVSSDITKLIRDAKGALDWSLEPTTGLVKADVGKVGMGLREIEQNVMAFVDVIGDVAYGGSGAPRPYRSGRPLKRVLDRVAIESVTESPFFPENRVVRCVKFYVPC